MMHCYMWKVSCLTARTGITLKLIGGLDSDHHPTTRRCYETRLDGRSSPECLPLPLRLGTGSHPRLDRSRPNSI